MIRASAPSPLQQQQQPFYKSPTTSEASTVIVRQRIDVSTIAAARTDTNIINTTHQTAASKDWPKGGSGDHEQQPASTAAAAPLFPAEDIRIKMARQSPCPLPVTPGHEREEKKFFKLADDEMPFPTTRDVKTAKKPGSVGRSGSDWSKPQMIRSASWNDEGGVLPGKKLRKFLQKNTQQQQQFHRGRLQQASPQNPQMITGPKGRGRGRGDPLPLKGRGVPIKGIKSGRFQSAFNVHFMLCFLF